MKALEKSGYKNWKNEKDHFGTTERWQARIDIREDFDENIPLCQCNDKLFINVIIRRLLLNGENHTGVEMEMCHENQDGHWSGLKIYSLTEKDIEVNLSWLENKLLRMWFEFNKD